MNKKWTGKRLLASFLALILALSTFCFDGLVVKAEEPDPQDPGPQTETFKIYKDADCTTPYEGEECIYSGNTVYAKISTTQERREVSILGYSFDNKDFNWPDGGAPNGYFTESQNGFEYSYDEETQIASLTIPEDKYNDDVIFIGYVYDDEEHNWNIDARRWVRESYKGLVYCDRYEDTGFVTYRYDDKDGKNVSEYRRSARSLVEGDGGLIQFANSSTDEIEVDGEGNDNLAVLTADNTPTVTSSDDANAFHLNWNTEFNCYSYYAEEPGKYYVSFEGIAGTIEFDVSVQTLFFSIYSDEDLTIFLDNNMVMAGGTVYAKTESKGDEEYEIVGYTYSGLQGYDWVDGVPTGYLTQNSEGFLFSTNYDSTNKVGVAALTIPEGMSGYDFGFVLRTTYHEEPDRYEYEEGARIVVEEARESSEGLLMCDWFENGEFKRAGQDEHGAWSEYGKWREMTEGESRAVSFAYCPTFDVVVSDNGGQLSDNLTILNISESDINKITIKRENGGEFVDVTDEAAMHYDEEQKCVCFEAKCAGKYRIYYNDNNAIPTGNNYVTYDVRPQTKHFELYKDASCEERYENGEEPCVGDTVYAKVWTDEGDEDELSIIGYGYNWDKNSTPDNWYATESRDGFEFSVDEATGVASLTLPNPGYDYEVVFAVQRKYDDGNATEVSEQLRVHVGYSFEGLVLCNRGDSWNGFDEFSQFDDKYYSNYVKNASIGVCDYMDFLLGNNPLRFDDGSLKDIMTSIKANPDKFTVKVLDEETGNYVDVNDDLVDFGYSESNEGVVDHYYFSAKACGRYRIYYSEIDANKNYVDIEIQKHRVALYTDVNCSDDSFVASPEIITNGTDEYYLYIDDSDPSFKITDRFIGIIEQGKTPRYFSFNKNDGKFYFQTYANGAWKIDTKATDLKDYLTLDSLGNGVYKVVFSEKEYQIQLSIGGMRYENIEDPNANSWFEGDERFYGIRLSNIGKLGVLDWLDGWENLGEEFDPEVLYRGGDEQIHATFHTDTEYWLSSDYTYFVPGILKDEYGEDADLIPEDAEVKIYKFNKTWTDVTAKINPVYVGLPESEDLVTKGLWRIKNNDIGQYKMEVKMGDDVYSMEYRVVLPSVGLYSSATSYTASTLAQGEVFQEINAKTPKVYYLYGKDWGNNGLVGELAEVEIMWPDYTGKEPTTYIYDNGKFYNDGEDATDEVATIFKIEKTTTKGLYKLTPWPCDTEIRFNFAFGEDGYIAGNSYFFAQSQKGLVVNECVDTDNQAAPGVWTGSFYEGDEYNYNKFIGANVGDTRLFALAVNANDNYVSENNCALTRLSAMTDLVVKKVDADGNLVDVDASTVLKYENNSVFSFVSKTEGTYRIIYKNTSYVNVYVNAHNFGLYTLDADATEYTFDDSNALLGDGIELTAEQAIDGKAEFYVVINGDNVDLDSTDYTLIEEYWINEANEESDNPFRDYIIYSADSSKAKTGGHTTYEQVDLTGKKVTLYGKEIENAIVYKVTTTRNGNPGLAYRNFILAAADTSDATYKSAVESDVDKFFDGPQVDFVNFNYAPADISNAEVSVNNKEINIQSNGSFASVELVDSDVTVTINGKSVENKNLYSFKEDGKTLFKTQSVYPGTCKLQVNGVWDFTGFAEGEFEITKCAMNHISINGNEFKYKFSAAEGRYVPTSMPDALSELEEGVDYEVVIEEYFVNEYKATITALPGSQYISGDAYIINPTKEDCGKLETPEIGENITMPYDGNAKTVKLKVVCDGEVLTEGRDYEIIITGDAINAGNYTVTVKGIGWYESCTSLERTLEITRIDISKATVTGLPTKVNYNADIDLKDVITVTLNKTVLPASAWELSGYDKTKAGTQNIQIQGVGNYTGSISKTITVNPDTALTSKNFKIVQADETKDFTYPNAPTEEDFKVQVKGSDGNYTDLDAEKYSITVSSTDKPGKVTVTATGEPEVGYSGTITATVTYKAKTLTKEMLGNSLDGKTFMYVPGVGRQLDSYFVETYVQGTDYTVKYANDTKVGDKATATVTGIGNYTGTFSYTYKITQLNFDGDIEVKVKNLKAPEDKYYTEKTGENADVAAADFILVYVDDQENEFTVPTSDYTVTAPTKTYKSGSKTAPIEYTFTIKGKTNCTGDLEYTISVGSLEREDISKGYEIKVNGESAPLVKGKVALFERTYTGASVISASDVTLWNDENEIDEANYTVTLANMTNAGKGSIIVTAKGNDYTGVLTADVNILPFEVVATDTMIDITSEYNGFNIPLKGKVDYGNIEITYDEEEIDPSNYTFSYSVLKVANGEKASLTVKYKGNYKGTVVYTPEMLSEMGMDTTLCGSPIDSWSEGSEFSITGTQTYEYTGNAIKPKFTVKAYGKKLTENKDYTLSYIRISDGEEVDNMQAVSDYYVCVHGCGMYSGDNGGGEDFVISVKGASIAKAGITLEKTKYSYGNDSFDNGTDAYGKIKKVMLGKTELTEGTDYTVEFIGNKKPGTATVKITGIGNYSGTATKTFTIDGKIDINDVTVDYVEEFAAYNPKGAIPETSLTYNGDELVYNQDYTVTASKNNKKLTPDGEYAYATIKGKGKYTGTLSIVYPYSIVPRLIDEEEEPMTYSNVKKMTGISSEHEDVTVYVGGTTYNGKDQNSFDPKPNVDGTVLKKGTDYDVYYIPWDDRENVTAATDMSRYATCKDAGSYCVLVVYKGNYDGVSHIAYRVAPLNISKVKANSFKIDYTGKDLMNERLIEASYGNDVLVQDKDFNVVYWSKMVSNADSTDSICDISYDCNDIKKILKLDITETTSSGADIESSSVGSHVAYMIGWGNFCGVKEVKYEILGEDIKKLDIKAVDVRFNPNVATQETTIYGTYTDANGITRYYDSDNANKDGFILEYSNNTKVGTGKVKVSHKCFKGSKTVSYKILARTMSEEWSTAEEVAVYDSKGAKPSIEVKFRDTNGREYVLVEGKDYTVSYKDNKVCNDTKKAVATIKCKGNFEGTWTHTFNVEKASIGRMSIKATAGNTWKPTVKITSDSGAVLKEKTDYQINYYYMNDTMVKCGKSYVKRSARDEVNAKDTVVSGTKIKVEITACGNYKSSTEFRYAYAGKYTVYDFDFN